MKENTFTTALLQWYRAIRRDLPWRKDSNPYRVWVSEVMLQQTRVEAVIPYFERFMERFPTLLDLAHASEEDVVKYWEGLGYYSRVRNLHKAVREVAAAYGGEVPAEYERIRALPGVGAYTAGAVLSIAYGKPLPAIDGNVLRVFSRLFDIEDDVTSTAGKAKIEAAVVHHMPYDAASDYNQAIMELGALVCIPRAPRCGSCPVQMFCEGFRLGEAERLPVKRAKAPPRKESLAAFLIRDPMGRICIRQRPSSGLLAGMWELPNVVVKEEEGPAAVETFLAEQPWQVREGVTLLGTYDHVFTHVLWQVRLYEGCSPAIELEMPYEWADEGTWRTHSFGKVFLRMLHDHAVGQGRLF